MILFAIFVSECHKPMWTSKRQLSRAPHCHPLKLPNWTFWDNPKMYLLIDLLFGSTVTENWTHLIHSVSLVGVVCYVWWCHRLVIFIIPYYCKNLKGHVRLLRSTSGVSMSIWFDLMKTRKRFSKWISQKLLGKRLHCIKNFGLNGDTIWDVGCRVFCSIITTIIISKYVLCFRFIVIVDFNKLLTIGAVTILLHEIWLRCNTFFTWNRLQCTMLHPAYSI